MEQFNVLQVGFITNDDDFQKTPILNVKVCFQNEIISYHYEKNAEHQWILQSNPRLLAELNGGNPFYHLNVLCKQIKKGTAREFHEKINLLSPKVLHHPKVRMKSVFCM